MKERVLRKRLAGAGVAVLVTAAIAGVFAVLLPARSLGADMVQTTDGKWFGLPEPKPAPGEPPPTVLGPDDSPTDDMLMQSENWRVDASYETVKGGGGFSKPAGIVKRIVSVEHARNEAFKRAMVDASSEQWKDAAEGFAAAAAAIPGWGKQEALWLRASAYAQLGQKDETLAAITDLLAAFPKSFYFCDAQVLRAKIAVQSGDADGAAKALLSVAAEKGMNARDLYRAEYARINLTLELQKKYDEARVAYQKLADTISRGDSAQGEIPAQQANVGIGNCFVAVGKAKEAEPFFSKASESHNPDVLAGAYAGLGDIAQIQAKDLKDGKEKNLGAAKARLEDSLLCYLRVTLHYNDDVEDEAAVMHALENQGKVYFILFDMGFGKEQELFDRGYNAYLQLWHKLGDGTPQKRTIQKLMAERKAALAAATPSKGD